MRRREFLKHLGAAGLGSLGALDTLGCRKAATRANVLAGLARGSMVLDLAAIRKESQQLKTAAARLSDTPTVAALLGTRSAWKRTVVLWKRGYCFRKGPLMETGALFQSAFWPARAGAIDALIAGGAGLDDAGIDELGVDLKGLYALEYLLFGLEKPDQGLPSRFAGEHGRRALALTAALASGVSRWSDKAASVLGNGDAFAAVLLQDEKASIDFLVNQMASTSESVARKLRDVRDFAARGRLAPREVEGWPSGVSRDVLSALIQGTQQLYLGTGGPNLSDLVAGVAPDVEPHLRAAFSDTVKALGLLAGPVETAAAAKAPSVERALEVGTTLEVALKGELASALGVTLTFTSGDGD